MTDIFAATGHRPSKLGGYDFEVFHRLVDLADAYLSLAHSPKRIICGMALGWDMACAEAAYRIGLPFIAAVPFAGQESKWPASSRQTYGRLLKAAYHVEIVCTGGYAAWKMQIRNEWMVARSDEILAMWDGTEGGTANCIEYATRVKKPITNLWAYWK